MVNDLVLYIIKLSDFVFSDDYRVVQVIFSDYNNLNVEFAITVLAFTLRGLFILSGKPDIKRNKVHTVSHSHTG